MKCEVCEKSTQLELILNLDNYSPTDIWADCGVYVCVDCFEKIRRKAQAMITALDEKK